MGTHLGFAASARASRGLRRVFAIVVVVALVIAAGYLYHPKFLILRPGPTADVSRDISIEGTWSERNAGTYLLTTVSTVRPNLFGFLWAQLSGEQIVRLEEVVPRGQSVRQYFAQQRKIFQESRMVAAAAAARAVGKDVVLEGRGALVEGVLPDSPAADVLGVGDVIVEVDGQPTPLAAGVQDLIARLSPGTRVSLTIERGRAEKVVTLKTIVLPADVPGHARSGIGVALSTRGFDIELPFEIEFEGRDIGGPSAGLAYALAIADMLQRRDYAIGTMGATGTIDPQGEVGPIGGLAQKAQALDNAGAELFLVPQTQVDDVEWDLPDLEVQGVRDLEEALDVLYPVVKPAQRADRRRVVSAWEQFAVSPLGSGAGSL